MVQNTAKYGKIYRHANVYKSNFIGDYSTTLSGNKIALFILIKIAQMILTSCTIPGEVTFP